MTAGAPVAIVGGGLAGSLLAIELARHGLSPTVLERRARYAPDSLDAGRSINLALAARGISALRRCGVFGDVEAHLMPMKGRMIHDRGAAARFAPYGQREDEVIYSVSRTALNQALYEHACRVYAIEYRFENTCREIDPETLSLGLTTPDGRRTLSGHVVFAADGAGSAVRAALAERSAVAVEESPLDHGYKELTIAPTEGRHALDPNALHIWPRGGFMLIALPNTDGSFTATLFLPHRGEPGFDTLRPGAVRELFSREFPDTAGLFPDLETQFADHPTGMLGTIRCRPWRIGGRCLLLGDAAHAIVPFHGQGMNAAFEDVAALGELLDAHGADWPDIFERFESQRAGNADAIADMALDNYVEMRDTVRDPRFELERALGFELERRFPGRFVPRYSMVMFHPEIPYATAQRRGRAQARMLEALTRGKTSLDEIDYDHAEHLLSTLPG